MDRPRVWAISLNSICLVVIFIWAGGELQFLPSWVTDYVLKIGLVVGVLMLVLICIPSVGRMISAATNYFFTRFGDPEITAEIEAAKDHTEKW